MLEAAVRCGADAVYLGAKDFPPAETRKISLRRAEDRSRILPYPRS
ncbi:MAG: hypothetical protein ACLR56_11955 [Oscillospiraceae bacterium]